MSSFTKYREKLLDSSSDEEYEEEKDKKLCKKESERGLSKEIKQQLLKAIDARGGIQLITRRNHLLDNICNDNPKLFGGKVGKTPRGRRRKCKNFIDKLKLRYPDPSELAEARLKILELEEPEETPEVPTPSPAFKSVKKNLTMSFASPVCSPVQLAQRGKKKTRSNAPAVDAEEPTKVVFGNSPYAVVGPLLLVLVVQEKVDKKRVSYVSFLVRTDCRNTKLCKLAFDEKDLATVHVTMPYSLFMHECKDVCDTIASTQGTDMLVDTLKGVFGHLSKQKDKTTTKTLVFPEFEFSGEYYNSETSFGLKKNLFPVDYSHIVKNKLTNKQKTFHHYEALIVWRAFIIGTDNGHESDEEDDDEMQQLAARTSELILNADDVSSIQSIATDDESTVTSVASIRSIMDEESVFEDAEEEEEEGDPSPANEEEDLSADEEEDLTAKFEKERANDSSFFEQQVNGMKALYNSTLRGFKEIDSEAANENGGTNNSRVILKAKKVKKRSHVSPKNDEAGTNKTALVCVDPDDQAVKPSPLKKGRRNNHGSKIQTRSSSLQAAMKLI